LDAQEAKAEEERAKKKQLPLKGKMPETPKFDPNDMESAMKFMSEKRSQYKLGLDESSAAKLRALARKKGYNIP
jgi:hypothetical protein